MPECLTGQAATAWYHDLAARARAARVPISASFELTRLCNLRCVHCYQGGFRAAGAPGGELDTAEVKRILDDLQAAGCLFLTLTGGEPLLRRDFAEIYTHACRQGFIPTVFTNATLAGPEVAELFRALPPHDVDVTLYGGTADVYEAVTGQVGSFARCLRGLECLLGAGVRVTLKAVLMTPTEAGFDAIEALARRYGVKFRIDAQVFPRFDGDASPMSLRVSPEAVARRDFADPERAVHWRRMLGVRGAAGAPDGSMFLCGAGRTACHIDAQGRLSACLLSPGGGYDLRKGSFAAGWAGPVAEHVARAFPEGSPCATCAHPMWCGYCPEYLALENGGEPRATAWMCGLAAARRGRAAAED